ncbi:MAG: hypothetical protein M1830_010297 [Pleopsidium flavum]|nr:MAG: hypothetical protein M1830_010381 [Pleopsidium flavum]KAI9874009.1 MAG: hypothetical protein M1830_010297 [Pleopsidium flavum]
MPPRDDSGEDDGETILDEAYIYPAAPSMQTTYSNVSSDGSFNGQYDTTRAFDSNRSMNDAILSSSAPFIDPLYFSSFQDDRQQSYAGIDESHFFSGL